MISGCRKVVARALGLSGVYVVAGCLAQSPAPSGSTVSFNASIRPLLSSRCFPCHGADEGARKAKLRLDQPAEATRERKGLWAIKPGAPADSEVILRITTTDEDDLMPPPQSGPRLKSEEVELLRRWIAEGARYEGHWAWVPPKRSEIPRDPNDGWARNEIDFFVLAEQRKHRLRPSPEADRFTLGRRLALDLTGLPPTPGEVRAFAADTDPRAYEHRVEELLASPAFGERWARPWLDLARFADSAGYGSDPLRPNLWPWREWVIRALNRNLPYDEFTVEQIAGDLLPNATEPQHVATAFHRNTMTNTEGGTDDEEYRVAAVKDRANTTAQVWMGLTLGCAQCHPHKFDPISLREYYQFYAFFNQTEDQDQPDERPTLPRPTPEQKETLARLEREIRELEEIVSQSTPEFLADLADWEERETAGIPWERVSGVIPLSTGGASFQELEDGSWVVSGGTGTDTYVLQTRLQDADWTALRFVLIPHSSLPNGGPGRAAETGNARLTELRASLRLPDAEWPRARFLRIELPGTRRVLSLAEVQVLQGTTNLALSGHATQSSTEGDAEARRAVDGRTAGDLAAGVSSETSAQDDPWWELDLGSDQPVEEVRLWNRTDRGLGTRLSDFKIVALNAAREKAWETNVSTAPNPIASFRLPPEKALILKNASAFEEAEDQPASAAIDGNDESKNGWSFVHAGETQSISFEMEETPPGPVNGLLVLTLHQKQGTNHTFGRFRLEKTNRSLPVRELPRIVRQSLEVSPERRTDAQKAALADFVRGFAPSWTTQNAELRRLRDERDAVKPVALPILRELAADQQRTTQILNKGNFLDPGDEVGPGVPEAFHPWGEGDPTNRLGLARWIVSRQNPLTARVAMNRVWAQLFGLGLVETEEDFGTQGSLPTHPELLDWLAVEFMERGWDLKAMIRLMVTSATYRQSSVMTRDHLEQDPRNLWLSRVSRRRLEAEMVRDQALALAGLLRPRIGGPSIFPLQPEGLWRAAFNGERTYPTSTGDDRYRRGIYVFLRRTVPYPGLSMFDAPSRESCTFRRLPTNTPLQAFVTLNDPVFVEAAQGLARRVLRESGPDVRSCLEYALRLCLGRPPLEEQVDILQAHFEAELAHYRADPTGARQLATEPLGPLWPGFSPAEAAAWTSVANVLLNMDVILNRG